ncbi:MAG: TonB-dependent siderophore receptor [Rhodospirillaceae bacterium]
MSRRSLLTGAALAALMVPVAAHAQRADENAVTSAEDAFGVSIGNQTVGLYSENSARGFSPQQAGNIRLEGLYFDQQFQLQRIEAGTTMRVGLTAQSYPFPAPTGIADIQLRRAGEVFGGSAGVGYGAYHGVQLDLDLSVPVVADRLGVFLSGQRSWSKYDWRGDFTNWIGAATVNWTPSDTVSVLGFYHQQDGIDGEAQPLIFTAGPYTPPQYDRSVYFGQWWADRNRKARNGGVITSAELGAGWRLRAGLFRAENDLKEDFAVFFRNVQPDGTGQLDILRSAPQYALSYSGEVRASRVFLEGARQHTVHLAVKGRDVLRYFGGSDSRSFGTARIGVYAPLPEPAYNVGPRSRDDVFQVTPGLSYVAQWRGVGELSAGVQKSFYDRDVAQPGLPRAQARSRPWLYNATLVLSAGPKAVVYAGYTRGLEESGIAPESATNRGEALPASLTEQIDGGVRASLTERLTFIGGVFQVKKPFFERDAANLFRDVGEVSHRGVELSLSGQALPGLTVVAGAMFLRARIEGTQAAAGVIGPVPIARPNRTLRLNLQYGPAAWRGFSLTGAVTHDGPMYATRANTLLLPASTTVDVGARYNFQVAGHRASARAQLMNVFNDWSWTVQSSGAYAPNRARRVQANLVADF